MRLLFLSGVGVLSIGLPILLGAQPAPASRLDVSGLLVAGYSIRTNPEAQGANKFDLDRVYLNFRVPVSERLGIRVTPDIAPQTSGSGYVIRMKYAYLQYDRPGNVAGFGGFLRAGLLQTVIVDHQETFWPRWMGKVAVDRFGYVPSTDIGVSAQLDFPRQRGELRVAISNGNGYTSPETDRFKSYAARLTLTPLASRTTGLLRTFAVSPWVDINSAASRFVNGGIGQVGPVGKAVERNRYGVWIGIRDPRLALAGGWSEHVDGVESGSNTTASPRTVTNVKGNIVTGFAMVRPMQLVDSSSTVPLGLLLRYDTVKPNSSIEQSAHLLQTSLIFDMIRSRRSQLALDYQETLGTVSKASIAPDKRFQVRLMVSF